MTMTTLTREARSQAGPSASVSTSISQALVLVTPCIITGLDLPRVRSRSETIPVTAASLKLTNPASIIKSPWSLLSFVQFSRAHPMKALIPLIVQLALLFSLSSLILPLYFSFPRGCHYPSQSSKHGFYPWSLSKSYNPLDHCKS